MEIELKMIKLVKSTFYNEIETKKKLCDFILGSKQLSMNQKCLEFETKFAKYQGRKYAIMVNSGSSANLALIQSLLNLKILNKKSKVGFSALTWATNIMPLIQLGLEPIPIDISLKNLNVCSDNLLEVLEKVELDALFITNLLGFCGNLDKISEICKKKGIVLIEDNCESLGSALNDVKLGNFGLASTTSFYVGHHMSTIEGGMVCTDDKELYDMLLMTRAHGWDRNLSQDKQKRLMKENSVDDFHAKYTFYTLGYNFRPTEITSFLGIEQLKFIEKITNSRCKNFHKFNDIANQNPHFHKLDASHMSFVSNFAYPLICKDHDKFENYKKKFVENNIEIRPIVGGSIIEQPFFKSYESTKKINFECSNAKKANMFGFYFTNRPDLTEDELELIKNLLRSD
tara:strand:+ start:488 stop:1687 length:1200 start_codon:yes stop_codon:yes gene_type:complete